MNWKIYDLLGCHPQYQSFGDFLSSSKRGTPSIHAVHTPRRHVGKAMLTAALKEGVELAYKACASIARLPHKHTRRLPTSVASSFPPSLIRVLLLRSMVIPSLYVGPQGQMKLWRVLLQPSSSKFARVSSRARSTFFTGSSSTKHEDAHCYG